MSALKLREAASVSRAVDSELSGTRLRGSANAKANSSRAVQPARRVSAAPRCQAGTEQEPLLVRAARSQPVPRPPAWMMRQAGRYMKAYQELTKKHPSFRERSETTDLIVEITLQPWRAFAPDGVILFSDILTPLDAMGIPFEIDESKGPIIDKPIRTHDALKALHDIDLDRLKFVDESLRIIRKEISAGQSEPAALLGFVGAPYTLATYCVEGGSTRTYTKIKGMLHDTSEGGGAEVLHKLLSFLAEQIATYVGFQVDAGAQCVQIFDSWGGQLTPEDWDRWSRPYIEQIINRVRETHPGVPLVFYINGNGGLLERMAGTGADVIGLDWTLDMADARRRLGTQAVQGNVDPAILFASQDAITSAVHSCVRKAGPRGHILNLGHGVLVGTPEYNVKHFFDTVRGLSYASVFADAAVPATATAAR